MHSCIIGCNEHVLWAHIKDSSYIYNICKSVSHQIISNQNPICSDSTNNSLFYDFLFKLKFKHVRSQSSNIETNVDLQYFQYLHGFNFSIILSSSQIRIYIYIGKYQIPQTFLIESTKIICLINYLLIAFVVL